MKLWFIFIYDHIANQNSIRFSVIVSYFTNFAVQNVNKAFVYVTDLTATLICLLKIFWKRRQLLKIDLRENLYFPFQDDSPKDENLLCGNTTVRLIVRDMCGKHCLDISTLFGPRVNSDVSFPGTSYTDVGS